MLHPHHLAFELLALGEGLLEGDRPLLHLLCEALLGMLAYRDILHREEDQLHIIEPPGVQEHRAGAEPRQGLADFTVIEDGMLRQHLVQQDP